MNRTNLKRIFLLTLLLLSPFYAEVFAQDSLSVKDAKLEFLRDIDQRNWRIKLPLWVPGFRGSFAYASLSTLPEDRFEFVSKLEGELGVTFYFVGDLRFQPKDWLFSIDGFHTTLANSLKFENIDKVSFEGAIDGTILRGLAGYRIFEKPLNENYFSASVFPYVGLRYIDLDIYSTKSDILRIRPDWFEVLVGIDIPLRYKRWDFKAQIEVGGFGINNHWSSFYALNTGYRFSPLFSMGAGWTYLSFNYDQGEGLGNLDLDIQLSGPMISIEFHL